MATLLKTINAIFTRELVGHLAARLGESEAGVGKALSGLLPVVLGGIISKAEAGSELSIYEDSIKAFQHTDRQLFSTTDLLGIMGSGTDASGLLAQGESLLAALFGASCEAVAEAVGSYAGIKTESAWIVLRLVGAVLPALLGQYAETYHVRPRALAVALSGLRGTVRRMLPRGLQSVAGLLEPAGAGMAVASGGLWLGASARKAPVASQLQLYQLLFALASCMFLLTLVLGYAMHKQGNASACTSFLRGGLSRYPTCR